MSIWDDLGVTPDILAEIDQEEMRGREALRESLGAMKEYYGETGELSPAILGAKLIMDHLVRGGPNEYWNTAVLLATAVTELAKHELGLYLSS